MNSTLLDLYLKETAVLASQNQQLLEGARERLIKGEKLSRLEEAGVVHTLQILIENAIGKAKQILKSQQQTIPTSAYDTIQALVAINQLDAEAAQQWSAIIGLRNRIVHEYMNLDMRQVLAVVKEAKYQRVIDFLRAPIAKN